MSSINIININISEIREYKNNPRKNEKAVEYVKKSILKFGYKVPIVLDKNYEIVTGHTRYKALQQLNYKTIPCIIAEDLSEDEIKAFRLIDNKSAELAEWDNDLLEFELSNIFDIDMDLFDFEIKTQEVIEDDEFEINLTDNPKTKKGDIYKMGNQFLMCGDSTNLEEVSKLVQNNKIDLLLTDPPYNVDYQSNDGKSIKNDKMVDIEFRKFLNKAFKCATDVMKAGAVFYIWHADTEGYNFRGACLDNNFQIKECLIWCKNNFVMGRQDYHWQHEPCLYGWKEGAKHIWNSDRKQSTILNFDKPLKSEKHPTMKPLNLFSYLINNSTLKNQNILDLFAGSGTTLISSQLNDRISFNMELDPRYCDVIIERFETLFNIKAELIKHD